MIRIPHINREISWLSFNERVLQEAQDKRNPLIERVRFLGIFSNNLDEFFRVRVASLRRVQMLNQRDLKNMVDDPDRILAEIFAVVRKQQEKFDETYEALEADLEAEGIRILDHLELSEEQQDFVNTYYLDQVRPWLVPVMLKEKTPFPELRDSRVYFAVQLEDEDGVTRYSIMEIPSKLPRFVTIPAPSGEQSVIYVDDVIRFNLQRLFSLFGTRTVSAYTIKITRDAELDIDDDISKSLVEKMSRSVAKRRKGEYVRFLYDETIPRDFLDFLVKKTGVDPTEDLIPGGRYHNRRDLMSFPDFGVKRFRFPDQPPLAHPAFYDRNSTIREVMKQDILLNYPYQKFGHVVDLLREAAIDPRVRRIRINLYRVAPDSHVVNALINGAKNGKKVTVVIELQARFDENNNIRMSNRLQENGVRVIFGVTGLKVHSKLLLISLKDKGKSIRLAHIGTGNFHEKTAKIYSDMSLLTADRRLTNEVKKIFGFFENNYQRLVFRHLIVSPYSTRRRFTNLINREIKAARAGEKAWITIKLNNLVDPGMIRKLYDASKAGVKVQLIIRGVCSLIPGIPGMSENISVVSIVGRYLEHSRILVFCNGGEPLYFISSADWMTRNLDYRIEVSTPIYSSRLQSEIAEYLESQLKDNVKSRKVEASQKNRYVRGRGGKEWNSQHEVYQYYKNKLRREHE